MTAFIVSLFQIQSALADTPTVPAGSAAGLPPEQPGGMAMMLPMVVIFAIMYFLMIRPQQKKLKEQQQMLTALKRGDQVVTSSGLLGRITEIADKVVTLEVATKVEVKFLKSQIAQVINGPIQDLQKA